MSLLGIIAGVAHEINNNNPVNPLFHANLYSCHEYFQDFNIEFDQTIIQHLSEPPTQISSQIDAINLDYLLVIHRLLKLLNSMRIGN
jgi:hypothetical protein